MHEFRVIAAGARSANAITLTVVGRLDGRALGHQLGDGVRRQASPRRTTATTPRSTTPSWTPRRSTPSQPDSAQTTPPGTTMLLPAYLHRGLGRHGRASRRRRSITPAVAGWTQAHLPRHRLQRRAQRRRGRGAALGHHRRERGRRGLHHREGLRSRPRRRTRRRTSSRSRRPSTASQTITRHDTTTVGAAGGAGLTLAKTVRNVTLGSGRGHVQHRHVPTTSSSTP